MATNFSVKVTAQGKGNWPAFKGQILEGDVLVGTFRRKAMTGSFIPPIEYKFRTDGAKHRFCDFADCLSIEETIEALKGM